MTSRRHRSGTDRIAEVASRAPQFTHLLNIQGDEPLTDPKLLDRMVREFEQDRDLEMLTAAHRFESAADVASPHQVKVILDAKKNALYFSRSAIPFMRDSDARATFLRHHGIYGYTRDLLLRFVSWKPTPLERAESLEQLRALENGIRIHVLVTNTGSPGIDTPADAAALERSLARAGRKERRP